MSFLAETPCPGQEPHAGHFWDEPGWKGRPHEHQYYCPGVTDPALLALTDDQLSAAQRELERREEAARKLRLEEELRHRQLARAELEFRYRKDLFDLLTEHTWQSPFTEPEFDATDDDVQQAMGKLLEQVRDLADDYRSAEENL